MKTTNILFNNTTQTILSPWNLNIVNPHTIVLDYFQSSIVQKIALALNKAVEKCVPFKDLSLFVVFSTF